MIASRIVPLRQSRAITRQRKGWEMLYTSSLDHGKELEVTYGPMSSPCTCDGLLLSLTLPFRSETLAPLVSRVYATLNNKPRFPLLVVHHSSIRQQKWLKNNKKRNCCGKYGNLQKNCVIALQRISDAAIS